MDTVLVGHQGRSPLKIRFSKNPTSTIPDPTSSPPDCTPENISEGPNSSSTHPLRSTTIATRKCGDFTTFEIDHLSSHGQGDHACHHGDDHFLAQTSEKLNILGQENKSGYSYDHHQKCSAFSVTRRTELHVSINSWGIAWRSKSFSTTKTRVLKKETLV